MYKENAIIVRLRSDVTATEIHRQKKKKVVRGRPSRPQERTVDWRFGKRVGIYQVPRNRGRKSLLTWTCLLAGRPQRVLAGFDGQSDSTTYLLSALGATQGTWSHASFTSRIVYGPSVAWAPVVHRVSASGPTATTVGSSISRDTTPGTLAPVVPTGFSVDVDGSTRSKLRRQYRLAVGLSWGVEEPVLNM